MRIAGEPAVSGRTTQDSFRNPFTDTVDQPVAKGRNPCGFGAEVGRCLLSRCREGCNGSGIQRAGADVPFLATAVLDGGQFHCPSQQEGTNTDGDYTIGSVSGDFSFSALAPKTMGKIYGFDVDIDSYPASLSS